MKKLDISVLLLDSINDIETISIKLHVNTGNQTFSTIPLCSSWERSENEPNMPDNRSSVVSEVDLLKDCRTESKVREIKSRVDPIPCAIGENYASKKRKRRKTYRFFATSIFTLNLYNGEHLNCQLLKSLKIKGWGKKKCAYSLLRKSQLHPIAATLIQSNGLKLWQAFAGKVLQKKENNAIRNLTNIEL